MESTSVCNTLLPSLEKLLGAEPQTESHPGPKIIKSILKACSTRKSKTSKDVVINETNNSLAPAKGSKNVSAFKRNSAPACKLKHVKTEDDISMFNDHQFDDYHNYPICELYGSYNHDTKSHNRIISLRRGIKPRNPQFVTNSCETYGSTVYTTTDHNDIEWFRRGEALEAKKVESLNANRSKTLTKRWVTKIN
ncbi:hypothetical protein Tco_0576437 [Tanacetum coccineum]